MKAFNPSTWEVEAGILKGRKENMLLDCVLYLFILHRMEGVQMCHRFILGLEDGLQASDYPSTM